MNELNNPFMPVDPHVGYAYVPYQQYEQLYEPMKALNQGTLFPSLDLPMNVYEDPYVCKEEYNG